MTIRKATLNDVHDIAEILVDSWRFAYSGIMPDEMLRSLSVSSRVAGWNKHLSKGANALVIEKRGHVVGVSEFGEFRDKLLGYEGFGEINVIYLKPQEIGKGFGAELMVRTLEDLSRLGYKKIGVWVLEKNTLAIDFYKKFSFSYTGEAKTHPSTGLVEHLYGAVI